MTLLRSLAFNVFYIGWTALLAVLGAPLLLAPAHFSHALSRLWAAGLLAALRALCGIQSVALGEEYIAPGPAIYAAKHQSAWDILMLILCLPEPAFVLKKELLRIPLFGRFLRRAGMVAIDRRRGVTALKHMQRNALAALHRGQPLIIFPEGTRTVPGAEPHYHRGVVALYQALKVPVVPVAIASGQCWSRNAFIKRPGRAALRFLPPIPPGLPAKELMAKLREVIEAESAKLQITEYRD